MNHFSVQVITAGGAVMRFENTPAKNVDAVIVAAFDLFDVRGITALPA